LGEEGGRGSQKGGKFTFKKKGKGIGGILLEKNRRLLPPPEKEGTRGPLVVDV